MKKLLLLLCLISNIALAQDEKSEYPISITAEFGINKHGTGDLPGYLYSLRVNKPISKRFEIIASFKGNLNDREDLPFIWGTDGRTYDSTIHDVLAGFQLNAGIGFNFINSKHSKLGVNPSLFGRYQANSIFSERVIDYPVLTGLDFPIRFLIRHEPGRTFAVGGSLRLYYEYKINSKYLIGLNPGFQLDSQEDTMIFLTLSFGLNL